MNSFFNSSFIRSITDISKGVFSDIMYFFGMSGKAKILFLGLDNAGKTTMLRMLTLQQLRVHEPTLFVTSKEFRVGGIMLKAFDLGGHESARRAWDDYYCEVDGVVFVVDAADRERIPEAAQELNKLLALERLEGVPFLILGNKIDIPTALSEEELKYYLDVSHNTTGKTKDKSELKEQNVRPLEVFMCSIVKQMGYGAGLRWLTKYF